MYKLYANALQLHSIHFGEDMKASENMEFISQGSTNNALCFIGPHRRFDPFARGFYSLEPGQGHFGPDAIPCAALCAPSNAHALGRPGARAPTRPRAHALPPPPIRRRGDARWRRGESVSLKTARDSMVSIELAAQAQMIYQKK